MMSDGGRREENERTHWSLSDYALLLQSVEWDGKDNEHSIIYFETQRSGECLRLSLQHLDID